MIRIRGAECAAAVGWKRVLEEFRSLFYFRWLWRFSAVRFAVRTTLNLAIDFANALR